MQSKQQRERMNNRVLRDMCPIEPFRTDADQAAWRAFESGAGRNDTPHRDAKPFADWYNWRPGYDERAHLHSQPKGRGQLASFNSDNPNDGA